MSQLYSKSFPSSRESSDVEDVVYGQHKVEKPNVIRKRYEEYEIIYIYIQRRWKSPWK